ncbi:coiled-coil domain-containing protein 171-like [Dendronephthya gigantea]|uniref:coiled-coil domain-containing protein 171-like n=1 Tax=Dendronephthya gigantea TaxID=151771 RepID=UPI00106C6407|nr:coiled-coil domain-containing protein 171-like [Dendronephthya gigantea]
MASEQNTHHNQSNSSSSVDYQHSDEIINDHPSSSQYEQEIDSLKLKVSRLEEATAEKMKIYNEEKSTLESSIVRLRAQVERGETTRQNLEYELTLAKKATNQVRRLAAEKDSDTLNNMGLLKDQLSQAQTRLASVEQELANVKNIRKNEAGQWKKHLQTKDIELNKMATKLEASQKECEKLNKILLEQQNSLLEIQEKCSSLEAQRQSQNNTLRHQAKDLEFSAEREERLKKDLEQARERLKSLEDHVEAERASHLETKFNSEIVQLRVRELETDLESKISSLNEALTTVDTLTQQNREFQERLKTEQEERAEISSKLKQLQEKYIQEKKRTKEDQAEKLGIIKELSQQLETHQQNFDILKRELNQAKKHQIEFDNNHINCLTELQTLVTTFGQSKHLKSKTGSANKESPSSSSSTIALLDKLRQIILDHETTRANAVNEAKQLKIMVENLTRENSGYQNLMWSRDQAVEDVKQAASQVKQELAEARQQLASKQKECSQFELEVQNLKKEVDEERRKRVKYNQEMMESRSKHAGENQTRMSFLHTIYQCLVAGQLYKSPPSAGSSYEDFSWEDMTRLLSDQIANLITELNRSKEKAVRMEETLNKKDDHIKEAQNEHEATIKKLSQTLKDRENSWKTQSKELEEHYGKLITDLHHRVQKTQEVADESWQNLQQLNTIREELEVQNKTLKNSRKKYIKEKTALLASCALLAGTLWPAFTQIEILKSQKRCLSDMNLRLNELHDHTVFLCDTLNSELGGNAAQGTHALLKFRIGVVAVLALHRFVNLALRRKTGITVSGGPVEGLETKLVVHCGRSKSGEVEFRGVGEQKCVFVEPLKIVSPSWFSNEQLLSHVVTSMNELCEKLARKDERDSADSWSPESSVSTTRIAKHCYQRLLSKLRDEFGDCGDVVNQSRLQTSPRSNLSLMLANGLRRCLRKAGEPRKHRSTDPEELVKTLQAFVLGLTQRLHKVEVERRDLRTKVNDVETENDGLRKSVEKRQLEEKRAHQDIEDMREKLTSTVPRTDFEKLYSELSNALEREKRAQDILNEQSEQLKDMERRLHTVNKNSEQTDITLAEAVKNLSEAKMEIRRKEQNVQIVTKDTQLVESEKRLLQGKLNDAEKAMTGAAREKETVLLYLKTVQKGLEENKAAIKQTRQGFYDLSKFLLSDAKPGGDGYSLGPTLLACQSVVNGFLEVHQQTLVLVTQVEAEKQQAQLKIESLENEMKSCRSHINTLKDELAAACQRQLSDDDLYQYQGDVPATIPPNNRQDSVHFIEQNDSESYNREYVPLMRYESLSPVKSPRKPQEKTSYSRRETKTPSDRANRSTKPSNR